MDRRVGKLLLNPSLKFDSRSSGWTGGVKFSDIQ